MRRASRRAEAEDAWLRVRDAVRTVGRYRRVDIGPATNATIRRIGGWVSLCTTAVDRMDVTRRDFVRLWQTAVTQSDHGQDGEPLGGFDDGTRPVKILISVTAPSTASR
jgi:hypothetical protein